MRSAWHGGAKAARLIAQAEEWTLDNPDAWGHMVRLAEREAAADRKFSMRWLADEVRKVDFVDRFGRPAVVNNNILPALARILVKRRPELARFMTLRRASVDSLGL